MPGKPCTTCITHPLKGDDGFLMLLCPLQRLAILGIPYPGYAIPPSPQTDRGTPPNRSPGQISEKRELTLPLLR